MNNALQQAHVLITRPAHQAHRLKELITELGGIAVSLPTLAIAPVADTQQLKAKLAKLADYDFLIFVSANAVTMLQQQVDNDKMPATLKGQWVAIGEATAQAMQQIGWTVDIVPRQGFNSEALLATAALQNVAGQKILIVRGHGGREILSTQLSARGANVDYLDIYQRVLPSVNTTETLNLLNQQRLSAITMTSGEALHNLMTLIDAHYHQLLKAVPLIVLSERIGHIAQHIGFKHIAVAKKPTDAAIVQEVINVINGEIAWQN